MTFAHYFLLFIMYGFLGWLCEVIYCSIPAKHFINRGFLHGPILPVYGFGGLLIVFLLRPYANTWIHLFLAAVVVASALEYLTSWLLETLFDTKWWDYSHHRFNIHGRVCLINSVLFGLLGVVAIHVVQPFLGDILTVFNPNAIFVLAVIVGAFFIMDVTITLKAMVSFNTYLAKLNQFGEDLKERFENEEWFKRQNVAVMLESVRKKIAQDRKQFSEAFIERFERLTAQNRGAARLIKAFPLLKSRYHNDQVEHLKDKANGRTTKPKLAEETDFTAIHTHTKKSFAAGLNGYKLFWIFFIGCILGTVVETMYCVFKNGYIQSRTALIYGPFNPVYGFGALIMTLLLYRLRNKRDLLIFAFSMFIGGVFEYCCSLFQQAVFHTVSWQYTSKFSLHGRTSLLYCFFWGILGLLWIKEFLPVMSKWIERIPDKIGKPLTWILIVFMACNITISALAVKRMSQRTQGIPAENAVQRFLDKEYPNSFLKKIYPNMIHVGPM